MNGRMSLLCRNPADRILPPLQIAERHVVCEDSVAAIAVEGGLSGWMPRSGGGRITGGLLETWLWMLRLA